ncbi:conserved hypothetical protein [Candidatus Sulfopaludibacter sp. SbA4]|nr:conserved hypothetical protein [Candidatus Sulfopaludibacter sp. SbA4]
MNDGWYEVVHAPPLTQGDLIFECPVVGWKATATVIGDAGGELLRAATEVIRADVVVMTQACDLMHRKVTNVIVCPHVSLTEYHALWVQEMQERNQRPTAKAWDGHCRDIRDGFLWNLSIMNEYQGEPLKMTHRIVDFHDVYTIPLAFLEVVSTQRRQSWLRFRPPYRENLSQAFARFFMRVGLPVPVSELPAM